MRPIPIHDQSEEYIIAAVGRAARSAAISRAPSFWLLSAGSQVIGPQEEGGDDLRWACGVAVFRGRRNSDVNRPKNVGVFCSDYQAEPRVFLCGCETQFLLSRTGAYGGKFTRHPNVRHSRGDVRCFIKNHDQIANTGSVKLPPKGGGSAITALLGSWDRGHISGRGTGASSPLFSRTSAMQRSADSIRKGRAELLAPFLSLGAKGGIKKLSCTKMIRSVFTCELDFSERNARALQFTHRSPQIASGKLITKSRRKSTARC